MHLRLRKCKKLPQTCGLAVECKFAVPRSAHSPLMEKSTPSPHSWKKVECCWPEHVGIELDSGISYPPFFEKAQSGTTPESLSI